MSIFLQVTNLDGARINSVVQFSESGSEGPKGLVVKVGADQVAVSLLDDQSSISAGTFVMNTNGLFFEFEQIE